MEPLPFIESKTSSRKWFVVITIVLCLAGVRVHGQTGFVSNENFVIYCTSSRIPRDKNNDELYQKILQENQERAEKIMIMAERYKKEFSEEIFDQTIPYGKGTCRIDVEITSEKKHRAYFYPKTTSKHHYSNIEIKTSEQRLFESTLAHEIVHLVIDHKLGTDFIPRWLDEGIASIQDGDKTRIGRRIQIMDYAQTDNWPSLEEVMKVKKVTSDMHEFYTMAFYFTQYLSSITPKNSLNLVEFGQKTKIAKDKKDLDEAAKKYYKMSFDELEAQWHAWVRQKYGIRMPIKQNKLPMIKRVNPLVR